jgi:hypothetical protein
MGQDVLDPVEFGVAVGVGGILPRLRSLKGDLAAASRQRRASRPIRIGRATLRRRWSASFLIDQRVKGLPNLVGRVVAVWMTKSSSSSLSRRGRPPAHRGSRQLSPISLNLDESGDRRHTVPAS